MDESRFTHLLDKYLQGKCTPEEVSLLHRFYDSFQEEEALEDDPDAFDRWLRKEKIHKNIARAIAQKDRQRYEELRRKDLRNRLTWKMAASALLIIGMGWGSYRLYEDMSAPKIAWIEKSTRKGQKATIKLTDGTTVYLNVDSKLSFPKHFTQDKREVVLEGEAFFEVAKNAKRPFIVKSGDLTTTVLGTSFNIKAFEAEPLQVTVASGKVKVRANSRNSASSEVYLDSHQQVFYNGYLTKQEVDIGPLIAWKEKVLHFEEASLEEVVVVLERWFNVSITIENEQLRHCKISGKYSDEKLMNIMESLEHILGIEYRMQDERKLIINGEKCSSQN